MLDDEFRGYKDMVLDAIIYFGCGDDIVGGQIQYADGRDLTIQEASVTIEPKDNALNLVATDIDRIGCYVSKYTKSHFYVLICSYIEPNTKKPLR